MIILTKSQGSEFSQATGKVMMLSSINILVYGLAVHYLYPLLGLFLGTILSYLAAAVWVVLIHPLVKRTV